MAYGTYKCYTIDMKKHMTYIPGVCNIGPAEIKLRRSAGLMGLVATVALWVILILLNVPHEFRVIIFLPATLMAIGYLQAWLHFCVDFGMRGLFNVGDDLKNQESVDQKEYRRKDQQKAIFIILGSILIGLAVAVLAYIL